jgi:uncharacterized protein (UPF0332 family)
LVMKMSLTRLEQQGRIKRIILNPSFITDQLTIADRNLASAERNLDYDPDIAYTCAYTAMLAVGRAFMGSKGYISDGNEQHYAVELFLEHFLDRPFITQFGVMRRKRHTIQYDQMGTVSATDAEHAITNAGTFVQIIKSKLSQANSGSIQ